MSKWRAGKLRLPPAATRWEGVAYACLALTIVGQILTASNVLLAQLAWLVSNLLFVARDVALKRPISDKVKDISLLLITIGLIVVIIGGKY